MIRNAMERWNNGINDLANNTGITTPIDYQSDLVVEQLDRDDTILKSYVFRNCFPLSVGSIDLNVTTDNEIETFDVYNLDINISKAFWCKLLIIYLLNS